MKVCISVGVIRARPVSVQNMCRGALYDLLYLCHGVACMFPFINIVVVKCGVLLSFLSTLCLLERGRAVLWCGIVAYMPRWLCLDSHRVG